MPTFTLAQRQYCILQHTGVKTVVKIYNIQPNHNSALLHREMSFKKNYYIEATGSPFQDLNPNSAPEKIPLRESSSFRITLSN
ncbi:protein of unknown function [Maridesulfovibrio hydrothermalis AM13 = DSM 14728]|uniref:Uncharacterized protein n=1 Tax=Maridesulfovibrio hydrothermalis AM13 = DSM 14728 TaxID=1121451 RepID=L0R701_9BACT|nr:protein of unknown function [Maridesulfovibrio hydrothermalis AM13 = DSM 14728]